MKHLIAVLTLLGVVTLLACPAPAGPATPAQAAPPATAPVVQAKIVDLTQRGNDVQVTLNQGSLAGVQASWHGELLDDRGQPVAGTQFTIIKVGKRSTVVMVRNAHFRTLNDTTRGARLTP